MRILLTGANGFIGGQLLAGLRARGHVVTAAVRDPDRLRRRWPDVAAIAVDFNRDTSVEIWRPRLGQIDAVINCAGVLHGGRGQDIDAIHAAAPIALFDACVAAGVGKVIQISAISADAEVGSSYALTKKRADDHLRSLQLDWTILRPSLVYGEGSYGGTSTLRGVAGLPFITPLPGDGTAAFRPIHIDDLVETVGRVLAGDRFAHCMLEPVGPETLTVRAVIGKLRGWLGLPAAREVPIPLFLLLGVASLADLAGGGPMGSAGVRQLLAGNAGREAPGVFAAAIGFVSRSLDESLARHPAQTQDLWQARLYFLRPLTRVALALMWAGSGLVGLLTSPPAYAPVGAALAAIGVAAQPLATTCSVVDLLIAIALTLHFRPRLLAAVQMLLVLGYTLGLSLLVPALWLDPFGALLKNLPVLAAIGLWAVLEEER